MISEADKKRIVDLSRKYSVKRILLFGSAADAKADANDIDLGVSGVPDSLFFKFYGELISALSKPVDLIDVEDGSSFSKLVSREGVVLYG